MSNQPELSLVGSGIVGNNQAIGVFVASITDPGKGRWRIWGSVRHTLPDSIRLRVGATNIIPRIPQPANDLCSFGPVTVDILTTTDDIILDLAVATGAADVAAGIIYAQRATPI
jgi:hypothetical protein